MKYLTGARTHDGWRYRGLGQHVEQGFDRINLQCDDARCDVLWTRVRVVLWTRVRVVLWTRVRVVLCLLLCYSNSVALLTYEVFVFRLGCSRKWPGLNVAPPLQVRTVLHNGLAIYLACPIIFKGSGFHESAQLAKPRSCCFHEGDPLGKPRRVFHESTLFAPINKDRFKGCEPDRDISFLNHFIFDGGLLDPLPKFYGMWILSAESRSGFYQSVSDLMVLLAEPCYGSYLLAIPREGFYAKRSNQGESSGSGGTGEERNGGGGDGNQGRGGGVGGGGHREGIGNERRGSGGRSYGGDNGDDDNNDRRGGVGDIEGERRPMDPMTGRIAEILLPLNVQVIAALESLDVTMLSARARILRVVSLGFNSGALVCFSASIRQRGTNPRLASILSWIGFVATFLGFISVIAMALLASFIP